MLHVFLLAAVFSCEQAVCQCVCDVWQWHLRGSRDTRHNSLSSLHLCLLWRSLKTTPGPNGSTSETKMVDCPSYICFLIIMPEVLSGGKKRLSSSTPIVKTHFYTHAQTAKILWHAKESHHLFSCGSCIGVKPTVSTSSSLISTHLNAKVRQHGPSKQEL